VKKSATIICAIAVCAFTLATLRSQTAAPKTAPAVKVAIIAMRDAMLLTQEGRKAGADLAKKYGPQRAALEKLAQELQAGDDQLRKGSASMSPEARQKLTDDLTAKKKRYDRAGDDLNNEMGADDNRLFHDMSQKMGKIIDAYAKANNYTVVLDAAQPVLWASETANITPDIIKAYDTANPAPGAPPIPNASAAPAKK
jgi:outer membrane protein